MLCQFQWLTHPVCQNVAAATVSDRTLAHDFIWRARGDILQQLKTAFRELVTEQFHHQSTSYFATLGAKRAAGDSDRDYDSDCDDSDYDRGDSYYDRADSDPKGKRSQASAHKW